MNVVIDMEELSPSGEEYGEDFQKDVSELPKVPAPIYRHAAPSAPWPWMDFDTDPSEVRPLPPGELGPDPEWSHYPQSLFGNWTHDQVDRCGILKIRPHGICRVHKVDVFDDGYFDRSDEDRTVEIEAPRAYWDRLETPPPSNIRVQALFVENMTVPILQILGTRYNVEPSFFACSANWIPSRYQEDPKRNEDHITVVLPFIRTIKNQKPISRAEPVRTADSALNRSEASEKESLPYKDGEQIIDTQAPLRLHNSGILFQDLLAIHMYRTSTTSTIISYHPSSESQRTPARRLQSVVQKTGDSVYWSKIFQRSKDPTFLFLTILWYALYAWDEAFEVLYSYINVLESRVLEDNGIRLTQELHNLQAHLLYHQQLLRDFRVSVEFVADTPNPAMIDLESDPDEHKTSASLLRHEANNLTSEIDRLTGQRLMLSDRLQNAIRLRLLQQEDHGKSSPVQPEIHSKDGNDLGVDVSSSTPGPQFDFDEPPPPSSSTHARDGEAPPVTLSHVLSSDAIPAISFPEARREENVDTAKSSQGRSKFKKWLHSMNSKDPALDSLDRPTRNPRRPANPQSRSKSPARTNIANESPSTMAAGQRVRRVVAKPVVQRQPKSRDKPAASKHPNKDTPLPGQDPADPQAISTAQQGNDPSQPAGGRVHLTHKRGSDNAILAIAFPAWMCCYSGTED